MGLYPVIWAPYYWPVLMLHAVTYDHTLDPQRLERHALVIENTIAELPCEACTHHSGLYLETHPLPFHHRKHSSSSSPSSSSPSSSSSSSPPLPSKTKDVMTKWMVDYHNWVNEHVGKRSLTMEEALEEFRLTFFNPHAEVAAHTASEMRKVQHERLAYWKKIAKEEGHMTDQEIHEACTTTRPKSETDATIETQRFEQLNRQLMRDMDSILNLKQALAKKTRDRSLQEREHDFLRHQQIGIQYARDHETTMKKLNDKAAKMQRIIQDRTEDQHDPYNIQDNLIMYASIAILIILSSFLLGCWVMSRFQTLSHPVRQKKPRSGAQAFSSAFPNVY
jgi:hypothetical protein